MSAFTAEAYKRLARAAAEADPPTTDHGVAVIAVATGNLSSPELEAARSEQERAKAEGRPVEPLGQILLRQGLISEAQYKEILRIRPGAPLPVPVLEEGAAFGRYRILKLLGRGGMSVVYRALDPELKREVALKLLRFAGTPVLHERLKHEAQAIARLSHPNIVPLYEAGEVRGTAYLAMELLEGESLARRARSMSRAEKLGVVEKVAWAIAYAHSRGIIHRDLKPGNIMIRPNGEPVVTDFGLAQAFDERNPLAASGGLVGTPLYMAPEQLAGKEPEIGPLADVYALGVLLFEMLTGRTPWEGSSVAEVVTRILQEKAPSPREADPTIPPEVAAIALKALEKDPHLRYPSPEALAEDLQRFRLGGTVEGRKPGALPRLWRRARRRKAMVLLVIATALVAGSVGFLLGRIP